MMDGGRAWRIDGWQSWLTWGRVVWPTCRLAVAAIAACLLPEVVTWADRPGQARPRAGPVESLHCSVAAAALDWTGSDLSPSTLRLTLYTSWSFRSCVPVLRPLTVTSQACWAVQVSCKRVVSTCLLTWHLAGPGLDCCYCLHFAGGWKVTVPPPWSRADCHFRARRGEM